MLDLLERMLKGKVGGLHGARTVEDALYNLEKTPGLAHVALVDIHLPGMDGIKLIEKIRTAESPVLKALPVIVLTGENSMDLYRRAARLRISGFLIKPVAPTPLIEALEGALAGRIVAVPRLDVDPASPAANKPAGSPAEVEHERLGPPPPDAPQEQADVPHQPVNIKA